MVGQKRLEYGYLFWSYHQSTSFTSFGWLICEKKILSKAQCSVYQTQIL